MLQLDFPWLADIHGRPALGRRGSRKEWSRSWGWRREQREGLEGERGGRERELVGPGKKIIIV